MKLSAIVIFAMTFGVAAARLNENNGNGNGNVSDFL